MTEQEKLGEKLQSQINENNRKKQIAKGFKTMSVREMGRMLGLKKTEAYYLVNQNLFKINRSQGVMRVDIESFEEWYANQDRYSKVGGPPPGKKLRQSSYSTNDISRILGITVSRAQELILEKDLPIITVDYRRRVPIAAFDAWYQSQSHYRNEKDRERDAADEERTMTMPDMAEILGISREEVYSILNSKKNKGIFEFVTIAGRRRITRKSFKRWYETQVPCRNNEDTYTVRELQEKCRVSRNVVDSWIRKGLFPVLKLGKIYRIPCETFDCWYENSIVQHGKD